MDIPTECDALFFLLLPAGQSLRTRVTFARMSPVMYGLLPSPVRMIAPIFTIINTQSVRYPDALTGEYSGLHDNTFDNR